MACLEHECNDCNEVWFDNNFYSSCPKCGSKDNRKMFDEQFDHYPEIPEEEEDEDDI